MSEVCITAKQLCLRNPPTHNLRVGSYVMFRLCIIDTAAAATTTTTHGSNLATVATH